MSRPPSEDIADAQWPSRPEVADEADRLWAAVYEDLHRMARRQLRGEADGHTLTATALVNEAYLRLVKQDPAAWADRTRFLAIAAQAMRRILVDYARRHTAARRGGTEKRLVTLDALSLATNLDAAAYTTSDRADAVIALDEALERLGIESPGLARLVEYRFYGGLSEKEAAEVLGVSQRTVARQWVLARGWLLQELGRELG